MRARLASAVAVLTMAAVLGGPALAGDSEAKERFQKGVALFKEGDYEGALVEFKAAYEAKPNYVVKYNIGTSFYKLHRYVEAKDALEEYLDEGGDDISGDDKLTVQGMLYEVQSLIGSITVACSVQGVHVKVNGEDAGPCPFYEPLEVDLGEYVVEVVAEGYLTFKKTVTVPGGKAIVVSAVLEADETVAPSPVPYIAVPDAVPPPPATTGYLSVEMDQSVGRFSPEVYVDGVLAGRAPLQFLEVEPGIHKIAIKALGSYGPYYETVDVAIGQTVLVTAKPKPMKAQNAIVFGVTWLVAGAVGTAICGALYNKTPPDSAENKDKRETYLILTISFGVITGAGLIVGAVGIALYTSFLKKDAKMKKEYMIGDESKPSLSISPFAAPLDGGGVLGLTGTF